MDKFSVLNSVEAFAQIEAALTTGSYVSGELEQFLQMSMQASSEDKVDLPEFDKLKALLQNCNAHNARWHIRSLSDVSVETPYLKTEDDITALSKAILCAKLGGNAASDIDIPSLEARRILLHAVAAKQILTRFEEGHYSAQDDEKSVQMRVSMAFQRFRRHIDEAGGLTSSGLAQEPHKTQIAAFQRAASEDASRAADYFAPLPPGSGLTENRIFAEGLANAAADAAARPLNLG